MKNGVPISVIIVLIACGNDNILDVLDFLICTLYQVEEASFYSQLAIVLLMGIEFNQVYIVNQLKYST